MLISVCTLLIDKLLLFLNVEDICTRLALMYVKNIGQSSYRATVNCNIVSKIASCIVVTIIIFL